MGREQVKKEQVTTEPALGSRFASIGIGLKTRESAAFLAKILGPAILDLDDPTRIKSGDILEDIAPWIAKDARAGDRVVRHGVDMAMDPKFCTTSCDQFLKVGGVTGGVGLAEHSRRQ